MIEVNMLFWNVKIGKKVKRGWSHNLGLESTLQAVQYQTGMTLAEMKKAKLTIQFLYRNRVHLGDYNCESGKFISTSFYNNNPSVARL